MSFTRRTHVVRVSDAPKGSPPSDTYFDIEVLDALAFRTTNNEEMILNFKQEDIVPYIVDDTGGGNEQKPPDATRRSHMKRIKDKATGNFFDAEVLDCCSFTDQNGEEWILNLPVDKSGVFNASTGEGTSNASRRTHTEKKSTDLADKNPTRYATVERTDMVAFRTYNGKEMIVKMESGDEGQQGRHIARASTVIHSPVGYDPTDDSIVPPPNTDPNIYVSFPQGGSPFTGDEKIDQGMLWWIRKVNSGGGVLVLSFSGTALAGGPALDEYVLTCPDGTVVPFFTNQHTVDTENLSDADLNANKVFTGAAAAELGPLGRSFTEDHEPISFTWKLQTVFVNLGKFGAKTIKDTKTSVKRFKLSAPENKLFVKRVNWLVAWDTAFIDSISFAVGPPTKFTKKVLGVDVYDQTAAFAALVGIESPPNAPGANGGTAMCGQIFADEADAQAFSNVRNGGRGRESYDLFPMVVDVFGTAGGAAAVAIETFDKAQVKDKDGHPLDHPHGPYQFPITQPFLKTGLTDFGPGWSDGSRTEVDNFVPWAIGFENSSDPWPGGKDSPTGQDFTLPDSSLLTAPAQDVYFDVMMAADDGTKDGKFRIKMYGTATPPPLSGS